jgi:hypothetical protein
VPGVVPVASGRIVIERPALQPQFKIDAGLVPVASSGTLGLCTDSGLTSGMARIGNQEIESAVSERLYLGTADRVETR